MPILPLTLQPTPSLHEPSTTVTLPAPQPLTILANAMIATMLANKGIGLAASQIGENIQLFVINKEVSGTTDHLMLCNPTITFSSTTTNVMEEGCLSCPKEYVQVRRPEKVRVKAYLLNGTKLQFKAKGLLAKVFQHEIDHLHGILILDKA